MKPTDPRAVLRVTDDLLWVLRREGLAIAPSQAIDAVRALAAIGLSSRDDVREALAAVVVANARDRPRFDRAFDGFFSRVHGRHDLWERLEGQGFSFDEIAVLREMLERLGASSTDGSMMTLLERGADLDRLLYLAGSSRLLEAMQSPLQAGFYGHRLLDRVGAVAARSGIAALRPQLVDALGDARASALVAALEAELAAAANEVRAFVKHTLEGREAAPPRDAMSTPFASLDAAELDEVRRAVRRFVERLRGGARSRRRSARRGRIDPHRTLRFAMKTGGVPFGLSRRARRRGKPKLVLICDVSESVRTVARLLLELAYVAQELFAGTRTFVFVSELGETTRLFDDLPVDQALGKAYSGAVVPVTHNSNYGRALRAFHRTVVPELDRRTTVVILGDGRTNYLDPAVEVLDAIRERARSLVWLCPEARSSWAVGDSAMPRYAPKCTKVLEVRCARDLEVAARLLVTTR